MAKRAVTEGCSPTLRLLPIRRRHAADVAKDQEVSVDSLVKAMVTATEGKLATAVAAHDAKVDRMKSSLTQRITDRANPATGSRTS